MREVYEGYLVWCKHFKPLRFGKIVFYKDDTDSWVDDDFKHCPYCGVAKPTNKVALNRYLIEREKDYAKQ